MDRLIAVFMLTCALLAGGCRGERVPSRNNELPFGVVDLPKHGELVGRTVDVVGWAMDDSAVAVVHAYVDGKYNASAHLTIVRPDVSKANPKYTRRDPSMTDIHGWRMTVDLGEKPGFHTILVQAVDDEGATRDLGSVMVTLIGRQ